LGAQRVDLRHREAAVVGDDQRLRRPEPFGQLCDDAFLVISVHLPPSRHRPASWAGRRDSRKEKASIRLGRSSARVPGCRLSSARAVDEKPQAVAATSLACCVSSSSAIPRVIPGSTWIPGPIVEVKVIFLMYRPLAAAGLARTISSISAA